MLGTPSEDDISFVTDTKAQEYLSSFAHMDRQNLRDMYKGCEDDAIDFLDKILQFNPYFRLSIQEAVEHPLFDEVRKDESEITADSPIAFDFEKEMLDRERLRELFLEEIDYFKGMKD